ncbi:RHS repeat domain-containing protein [Nucisporomicrobium flavum]|uniref:RHS repeat domain-containing protein n=1 Tax=Nucisporomicrobium flavum TaxID=2785915 RepID=UPI003C2C80DC
MIGRRSVLAAVLVTVLTGPVPAARAAAAEPSRPRPPAALQSVPGGDHPGRSPAKDPTPVLNAAPATAWPAAGTTELTTVRGSAAQARSAAARTAAGAGGTAPLVVAGEPRTVRVQTLDRARARGAGQELVFRVSRTDGAAAAGRAVVALRYGSFAGAYGGDWAGRLRLLRLPECALRTPGVPGCAATPLRTTNDVAAGVLSAEVGVAASGTLVALAAGPSGDGGDYQATDLKPSGTWSGGGSAGDFAWSYALRTPPALGGPAPTVALGYSAQAVDGFTAATNAQPSWAGEGFGWQPGSIDRGYRACADDGHAGVGDLCWAGESVVLSLNGRSSPLVYDAAAKLWRPAADDGSRVERLTDTGLANGDDDGEHWKVTTTDGTQYFFGLNRLPGWRASEKDPQTDSVSYVPVFGNDEGEPCHRSTFAASSCQQAYRWGLDYVVDPRGNTMSYFYSRDINRYARNVTDTDTPEYVRSSQVREIAYGTRQEGGADTVFAGTAPARVLFATAPRCITPGATCVPSNPANFPDAPLDQSCTTANCRGRYSPTFWTLNRLAGVRTEVASGTKTWRGVDEWRLEHEFKNPGDGQAKILWLRQITHCGLVGGELCLPPVTFTAVQGSNRVDPAGSTSSIIRYRMRSIVSESGSQLTVTYSEPECVAGTNVPSSPDTNTKLCFPLHWLPPGASKPKLEYFHKYVVKEVTESDLTGASPDQVTTYAYPEAPAWHSDDNALTLPARRSWGQWRGYGKVVETVGAPGQTQSRTTFSYFRGMNGDRLEKGTRSAELTDWDGNRVPDSDWLTGQLFEQFTHLGTTPAVIERTRKDPYQFGPTATASLNGVTIEARVVNTASTRTDTALDGGRGWRTTRQTNVFLPDRTGRLDRVDNEGDVSTTADDQCTRYTYATDAAGTSVTSLARVQTVSVRCQATPDQATDVLSDVRTWYDGATAYGTTLTAGLATRVEERSGWDDGAPVYTTTSRRTHDRHGRVAEEFDALDRRTATAYTPATGGPVTRTVVTDPMGWTTAIDSDPAWGAPTVAEDVNRRRTETAYDPLGRLTGVWLPGRGRTDLPDIGYTYTLRNSGGPTVVTTKKLNPAGTGHIESVTLYDGRLRERQRQVPAVGGGRMISETIYDSRGLAAKTRPAYFNAAAPSPTLFAPTGDTAVPAQTVTTYDGAGRPSVEAFQVDAAERWRTTTTYGGDHTRVAVPVGGTATANWLDARGNVVTTRQYHGNEPAGAYDETVRTYTKAGDLESVTDAAGTTWRYRYDQRRRKIRDEDPDKGVTKYGLDDAGQLVTMTDARDVTLAYEHDALGRRTAEHKDSVTGPLLAEWTYDTLAKGKPTSAKRHQGTSVYETGVTGYTDRYQPTGTRVVIPAAEGTLAGEYTSSLTYAADGSVATRGMPARTGAAGFGGLADETLTYGYNGLGMPTTVSGLSSYVTSTEYRQDGQLSSVNATDGSGRNILQYWTYEHGTARLAEHQVLGDFAQVVAADTTYRYDQQGNVLSVSDDLAQYAAGQDDTQCFRYDHLRRLTNAWTPRSGDCGGDPAQADLGGPAPYRQAFGYTASGNRTSVTEQTAGGTVTRTLAYPGPDDGQPHAVTSVTSKVGTAEQTDGYDYDDAGNTTRRPGPTGPQKLDWDAEGRLAALTENGATASIVYDADGNRLVQREAKGSVLYLGGAEFRSDGSGKVTGTRLYDHASAGLVASRTAGAGLFWQAGDHQGTSQHAFRASDLQPSRRRATPFGGGRGTAAPWPTLYGFVGGAQDGGGTVHLGAREYDPALGRFISVDPILDVADPQSMQGYAYANNTPVTGTDADGLRVCLDECGRADDLISQQHEKAVERERKENLRLCPRNVPREDCTGSYKPDPRSIKDQRTYRNGTKLTVYHGGAVEINGYILPTGHPDPYLLAEATDGRAPEVERTRNGRSDFEQSIRGVAVGCESLGKECSPTFARAVVNDARAAHDHSLLPSYIGGSEVYGGEPDAPEVGDVAGHQMANDAENLTGFAKMDAQRKYHEAGYNTTAGYKKHPKDRVAGAVVACVVGALGVGTFIGVGTDIFYDKANKTASGFLTKGARVAAFTKAGVVGCATNAATAVILG